MVRKIKPTAGGWRKSFGAADKHSEFERLASRALADFFSNSRRWRDIATRRLTAPLTGRRFAPTMLDAFHTFAGQVVDLEIPALPEATTGSRHPLDAVEHRSRLRDMLTYKEHADRLFDDWLDALAHVVGVIADRIPGHSTTHSPFTVPLIFVLERPVDVVQQIVARLLGFAAGDTLPVRPGTVLAARVQHALLTISKLTDDAARKNPHRLIAPADSGLTGTELVAAYLADTPFFALLTTPVPFSLPEEKRYAGHYIIAPSGQGKTTLQHTMLSVDLKTSASVIVMDSKGDLLTPIKTLALVKDRLLIIEPDPEFPLALNPLDIPKANVNHLVSLLEYVFSALLEAKMTALQMTLFRTVLPAIVKTIANPTLQTFIDIVTTGVGKYQRQFATLPEHERAFFYDTTTGFLSKTYTDTRNQLIWRLQFLMTNPIIKQMFSAPKTKLDIGREMDAGKVILINNSKRSLGDEGAEFFGRFFIALVLAAAEQRSGRRQSEKRPCFFYIDECHNVIKRDEKIPTILDECRSQKIGMVLAHQRTDQILSENVLSALANCAIRMANSDDEAKYLADKLRTDIDTLQSLPIGSFATFIRGLTSSALTLKVPDVNLWHFPRMLAAEEASIRDRMRANYSFVAPAPSPDTSVSDETAERSDSARTVPTSRDQPRHTSTKRDSSRQQRDDASETGTSW
jgi:hypothetical protein